MGVAREPSPVPLHPGNLCPSAIHGPLVLHTYMREFPFPEGNETPGSGFYNSGVVFQNPPTGSRTVIRSPSHTGFTIKYRIVICSPNEHDFKIYNQNITHNLI